MLTRRERRERAIRAMRVRRAARTRADLDVLDRAAGVCEGCGSDRLPLLVCHGLAYCAPCVDRNTARLRAVARAREADAEVEV
jgi:hypothetical protein